MAAGSTDGVWTTAGAVSLPSARRAGTAPQGDLVFRFGLNRPALLSVLDAAPMEWRAPNASPLYAPSKASQDATGSAAILSLPLPDGSYQRFRVEESPIVDQPIGTVRTYRAAGIDDPTASARLDWGPAGFHGYILSTSETVYIDPWTRGDTQHYISFYKSRRQLDPRDRCLVNEMESEEPRRALGPLPVTVSNGTILRTYRLAVALTGEYTTTARLPSDTDTQARQRAFDSVVTAANRVNAIYERELSVRLTLLNRLDIVYTNPATDPYTGDNLDVMLGENMENMGTVLGAAAFDVGHVLTSSSAGNLGGGARAGQSVVCSLVTPGPPLGNGPLKAQGATSTNDPTADTFVVELWAHEVGHQFGAMHSFNTSCGGDSRTVFNAYEPGSGSTLMSYFGPCGNADLALSSHDNFHVRSLEQIFEHLKGAFPIVSVCGTAAPTGNSVPTVSAGNTVVIPKGTPFALTATASDPDGDPLTYSWEEYDLGAPSPPDDDVDGHTRPLFRAYPPGPSPTRTFPKLEYILNNASVPPATYTCAPGHTCTTGEVLPSITRTMQFQVTVRDNLAGGGAVSSAWVQVQVAGGSGPFRVTSPNTAAFDGGETVRVPGDALRAITWDVASTTAAPVSAANVKISLSIDGGTTFPFVLAPSTPNDGSESVRIPKVASTTARVKVEAVGNVFFDISDANFTITAPDCDLTVNPLTQSVPAAGDVKTATVTTAADCAWAATSNSAFITVTGVTAGLGTGPTTYSITANPTASVRVGTLTIAGQTLTVTQAAGTGNVAPTVIITTPSDTPATATSPFITLAGTATDDVGVGSVSWTSNRGPVGSSTGTTNWTADVPLFAGANVIAVTATDTHGATRTATKTVNVSSFVYYLAEGATGSFFDLEILLGNPNPVDAPVAIRFLRDDGVVVNQSLTLASNSRATVLVDAIPQLEATAVSAVITSTGALPLLVERTMRWGAGRYGAHTEKAVGGASLNWFFAEGSQGFFDTYLLLANPNVIGNSATVQFLTEGRGVITRQYSLLPNSRLNVFTRDIPELALESFGINVTFVQPGVAERAMYFGSPVFNGGHESAGVNEGATSWYHAEGATGAYFDTFVLISNPNAQPASVTLRFLPESGVAITKTRTIPANARLTVDVEREDPALANVAVAVEVTANVPVISERTMYWPGGFVNWFESHNSFGLTRLATRWGLAEGRVGNPSDSPVGLTPNFDTFILLANPGATEATVTINYLRTTGAPIAKTYLVAANSRFNVHVNGAVSELANESFAAVITSTVPIAVERALYSNAGGVVWAAGTNATGIRIP